MRIAARAFIKNWKWKFLLAKHKWKSMWSLPWWGIKPKESIFKCIKREIKEEFNLKIKLSWETFKFKSEKVKKVYVNPICSYQIEFKTKKYWTQKKIEHIFLANIKNDISQIKIQKNEIWEYKFFTLEEIIKLENTFSQIKEIASYLKECGK